MISEIKAELKNILTDSPNNGTIRRANDFFEENYKLFISNNRSENLYCFLNNITEKPKCVCGKKVSFVGFTRGYRKYCSARCQTSDPEFQDKMKKINLQKYGVENIAQRKDVKNKTKATNLKKYGVDYILRDKNKRESGMIKKYGVNNISKLKETTIKRQETNLKKYGMKSPWNQKKVVSNNVKIKKTNYYNNLLGLHIIPLFDENEYLNIKKEYKWKCEKCKKVFYSNLERGKRLFCSNCNKSEKFKTEKLIKEFLNENSVIFKENDRKIISPKELDIYLPDHNLAIEIDGLYWHSDIYKDKNYHLEKTEECNNKGIKLIHIFENEINDKFHIVKNRLKNILGLNSQRIGARQTIVKEIDSKIKNGFLNKYHIQGEDKSRIKLGAFYDNKLIGVMTFSKPRIFMNQKKKNEVWELSRFATTADTYTPGLASKMLKHFERNWEWNEIYSYADRRWSQGNLYKQLGFELDSHTPPNYFYWNGKKLYHRYNFRKQRLKNFDNYSDEKTEKQMMDEVGWYRIYDCGNIKFIKENNNG